MGSRHTELTANMPQPSGALTMMPEVTVTLRPEHYTSSSQQPCLECLAIFLPGPP